MPDPTFFLCAAVVVLAFGLVLRFRHPRPRRACPGCGSPMRRRAIADGHVWMCCVCGRVRVEGP
jgi:hypothetical protein